jgi:large subunit ribosomal protein L29
MRELNAEKIREMTEDEIVTRVRELHEEIFNLRFRNSMRQLQNPLSIRERRRDIARLTTILAEHRSGIRKLAGHAHAEMSGAGTAPKAVKEPRAVKAAPAPKAEKAKSSKPAKEPKAAKAKAKKESKK